jgi:hypothetical protein
MTVGNGMMKEPGGYCAQKSSALAFCRLIVSCYFTVFAMIPLSHIHVEEESVQASSSLREPKSKNESFLLILHEVLSLHFKDRTDHTFSFRNVPPESRGDDSPRYTCGATGSSLYQPSDSGPKSITQRCPAEAVDGLLLFPSGLSPPSP